MQSTQAWERAQVLLFFLPPHHSGEAERGHLRDRGKRAEHWGFGDLRLQVQVKEEAAELQDLSNSQPQGQAGAEATALVITAITTNSNRSWDEE